MYRDVNVLRLLPDRPGRGGSKFGYHSFQQTPILDTRDVKNVHVWQDSWRQEQLGLRAFAGYAYPDTSIVGVGLSMDDCSCLSLHGYTKFSLSDPTAAPTTEVLGHNYVNGYASYVWNFSVGTASASNHSVTSAAAGPAVFCNIDNRCFIATGMKEAVIYDSSRGPALYGATGTPRVYTLGVDAPTAAPVVSASDVIKTAEIYLRKSSMYISHPDVNSALFNAAAAGSDTLIVTGGGRTLSPANAPPDGIDIATKTTSFSTTGMTVSIAPKVIGVYNGNIATFTGAIPTGSEWVGLRLTVNGEEFTMMAFGNDPQVGDPTLAADQCLLHKGLGHDKPEIVSEPFTVTGIRWKMRQGGADAYWPGGITITDPTIVGELVDTGGRLTWTTLPPSYAYAWYDPETGHISNISPVWAPAATSKTDVGVRVNVDVGSISYPPSTSSIPAPSLDTRWTHILFFRTLMAGGSTLYPIGSLSPTIVDEATGGTIPNPDWKGLPNDIVPAIPPTTTGNYWYDSARDAELLVSGALRAPQFTNGKPRIVQSGRSTVLWPAHMAYWDGRLWIAATQDPAALHFSCDRTQCPFGIPEESFPDTNVLRIPASDGRVCGMKLIGESLLITTERWAYTVVGNNESNYRLVRISTRMAGVGDYQMDEFVPDVEGESSLVVFVGTDSKIYAMPLGGQAVCISKEIQTYLDSARLYGRVQHALVRVHAITSMGRRVLLVYIPAVNAGAGKTFLYDFDQKIWTEQEFRNDSGQAAGTNVTGRGMAWASIAGSVGAGTEIYATPDTDVIPPISPSPIVQLRQWFNIATTTPLKEGYIRTFPLDFDGKKTRKRLHFVRIYVNNPSYDTIGPVSIVKWGCHVRVDSAAAAYSTTFETELDAAYDKLRGGSPVDSATAKEMIATDAQLTQTQPNGSTPLVGYTFDVSVYFPGQIDMIYQLYAVEIGWSTLSDGQEDM